jgi:glycosyltransferase involved in cell wall biosynthesis
MMLLPMAVDESTPDVSVVMAVYNGAASLAATIDSVLAQTGVALELIVVDDGSRDGTARLLERLARDEPRMHVITRDNRGLTRALIVGCAAARAAIIARQDCGDLSLPGRLSRGLEAFRRNPRLVLWGSETEFTGPADEPLYTTTQSRKNVRESLLHASLDDITALSHHGSAMFRADAYARAGGYREQFYFAQDLDLWTRLAALGDVEVAPDVLYRARIEAEAISSRYRALQIETARIILALRDDSLALHERESLLARAAAIRPDGRPTTSKQRAQAAYFLGSCLARNGDRRAGRYFRAAVRHNPLSARAWLRVLTNWR